MNRQWQWHGQGADEPPRVFKILEKSPISEAEAPLNENELV